MWGHLCRAWCAEPLLCGSAVQVPLGLEAPRQRTWHLFDAHCWVVDVPGQCLVEGRGAMDQVFALYLQYPLTKLVGVVNDLTESMVA